VFLCGLHGLQAPGEAAGQPLPHTVHGLSSEGVFLDVNWDKILHAIHNHHYHWILLPPLAFYSNTAESGWWLDFVYIIFLFPFKEALFVFLLHFIYI
jgi:hypothetical protein